MARILLTIPDEMLADLDEKCEKLHYDRSEYVRGIIRDKIYFVPEVSDITGKPLKKISVENFGMDSTPPEREDEFVPEFTPGFCSVCRGKRDDTKQVKYNDPNGEEIEQVLCRKHIKTLERHFENNGGGFI